MISVERIEENLLHPQMKGRYLCIIDSVQGIDVFDEIYEMIVEGELLDILILHGGKDPVSLDIFRAFEDVVLDFRNVVGCVIRECNLLNPLMYVQAVMKYLSQRKVDAIIISKKRKMIVEKISSTLDIPIITF